MVIIAKGLGLLIGILGIVLIVYPEWIKKLMAFWKEGSHVYWAAMVRLVIGVILLIAASRAAQPMMAATLGILFLVSGVIIFVMGAEEGKKLIAFWESQPSLVLRLLAVFVVVFGTLVFFAI